VTEWPIRDVAKATGLSSRALRHYEDIGLLTPSKLGPSGYRFYGEPELARLYRILSLRALEMPLAAIQEAIDGDAGIPDAMRAHLSQLHARQQHTAAQIAAVEHALTTIENGTTMTINELFAGADHAAHEEEVRRRWGNDAWERSQQRREAMTPDGRVADDQHSVDVNVALRAAAEAGADPASALFQELVTNHYAWVTEQWGGRAPTQAAYLGLSQMYVDDERFATFYGGESHAETIRTGIRLWADAHLSAHPSRRPDLSERR
jgi:DNA-binding transcriptional MerR regulator